jgi:hypothetical protein
MSDKDYIEELEKIVIFLCDVYTKGADSLAVQVDRNGETDDKWVGIYMSFPTIQGSDNRFAVRDIGNLREKRGNREAPTLSLRQLYERLKVGREAKS